MFNNEKVRIYLDYLIATAWHDGVIEEHRRTLQSWFEDPTTKVSRAEALTFLSLLPIFEDWDTWGCVVRAQRSSSNRLTDAFPPPCAQDWSAPLSVVELDYKGKIGGPSATLLNGQVDIEAICLDLASPGSKPVPSPRQDFFDQRYCLLPQRSHRIPYRFYAALVDPILTKLAPSESPNRQFVIAYPLSVAGRLHFLQIALSPPREQNVDVNVLWEHWEEIHKQIWTPSLRAFLREEMQRIVTSAFQHEAHSRLEERIRQGYIPRGDRAKIEAEYKAQLYECLYHLFPVESVTTPDFKYGYKQYFWSEASGKIAVGSKWDNTLNKRPQKIKGRRRRTLRVVNDESSLVVQNQNTVIVVADPSSNKVEDIAEDHRVHHSITEQAKFLDRLRESAIDIWMDAEDDRRKCAGIVKTWARSRDWKALRLDDLKEEPCVKGDDMPKGREPFSGRYQPRSIRRYVAQMRNIKEDDDHVILDGLKSAIRPPSLLLQTSEYFETGAAKLASHLAPGLYYTKDLAHLKSCFGQYYEDLHAALVTSCASLAATRGQLCDFHKRLSGHLEHPAVKDLDDVYCEKLAARHKTFRVETFLGIIEKFRCYYIDPVQILKPVLCRFVTTDRAFHQSEGIVVRRSNEFSPHEWVKNSAEARTRRVDYFISFPSAKKQPLDLNELKSANMLQLWTEKSCQTIADILVHSKDSTYVFIDSQFIEDKYLHTQICGAREACKKFGDATFWVILRLQVWRTFEGETTTEDLEVSSFTLDTLKGALECPS